MQFLVEHRQQAEQHLVAQAAHFDADTLKILGHRLFEVIAPDLAETVEGRVLEAQEAKALRKVSFSMWEDAEGICHGQFRVPHLHGQMLTKALQAFTNPARPEDSAIDPDLPTEVRNGLAFTSLLEAIPASWLPKHGGVGATVVVTMTLEQLLADLDAAGACHPTPAAASVPPKPDASPARPGSSRWCSVGSPNRSTSAASAASTPKRCDWRWVCAMVAAPPRVATGPPRCATPITTSPGR